MATDPRHAPVSTDLAAVIRLLQVHGVDGLLELLAIACELEAGCVHPAGAWPLLRRFGLALVSPDRWQEFARCLRLYASADGWRGPALVDVVSDAEVTTCERGEA